MENIREGNKEGEGGDGEGGDGGGGGGGGILTCGCTHLMSDCSWLGWNTVLTRC